MNCSYAQKPAFDLIEIAYHLRQEPPVTKDNFFDIGKSGLDIINILRNIDY